MRRLAPLVLLALVTGLAVPAQAADEAAGRQHGTFSAPGLPTRDYALYVPSAVAAEPTTPVPLLVYLHGCNQTADDVAVGTRLEQLAEDEGLLVLFPEQRRDGDGNGAGCWNWFVQGHQHRGAGEPASLAGMTREVRSRFAVDDRRVWLSGVSAGADMATVLGASYPDVFTALAPIAGCAYLTCSDASGTAAYAEMGEQALVVPTLVVQGDADVVSNAALGASALEQWLGTNDLADDGAANGSVPRTPTSVTRTDAVAGSAPGDLCVGVDRLPCAGGIVGLQSYPTTRMRYDDAGGRSVVEALIIHGANHAWTGGDPRGSFVDPVGPDLAHVLHDFFAAHPRA